MSFYNVDGEEVSEESILTELIGFYEELHDSDKTKIDDFNEGSEVRTLMEVLSHLSYNILEEMNQTLSQHFINTAEGEYLDLLGANPNVNLERSQGTTASGLVKFTLPEVAISETTIPSGTIVSTDDMDYETLEDSIVAVGESYVYVPVECTVDGEDGNCRIGAIKNCELPEFTVTNDEAFVDGSEFEDDEDYRQRLLEYIRSDNFGSRGWYENQILLINGVHDIEVNESSDKIIAYYVNTNDLSNSDDVYTELVTFFTDNNNIIIGHTSEFIMSRLHDLSFTVTVPSGTQYSEDDIKDFFKCYIHGGDMQNYPISYEGLNMGVSTDATTLKNTMLEYFTDLSDLTISDVHNVYDGDDTESFDFVDSAVNNAYSLSDVTVVFE